MPRSFGFRNGMCAASWLLSCQTQPEEKTGNHEGLETAMQLFGRMCRAWHGCMAMAAHSTSHPATTRLCTPSCDQYFTPACGADYSRPRQISPRIWHYTIGLASRFSALNPLPLNALLSVPRLSCCALRSFLHSFISCRDSQRHRFLHHVTFNNAISARPLHVPTHFSYSPQSAAGSSLSSTAESRQELRKTTSAGPSSLRNSPETQAQINQKAEQSGNHCSSTEVTGMLGGGYVEVHCPPKREAAASCQANTWKAANAGYYATSSGCSVESGFLALQR